jgi:hypothetical protein
VNSRLTDELRHKITARLKDEPSDTKLSNEFGVSRKTIWRLRRATEPRPASVEIVPPAPEKEIKVEIPATPKAPSIKPKAAAKPKAAKKVPAKKAMLRHQSSVMPKVDTVKVHLSTYFAVQLLRGENVRDVLKIVMDLADKKKNLFRKIQILDITPIGGVSVVRFRSDMEDAHSVVKDLKDRVLVTSGIGGYQALFPTGRVGKFPASIMCVGPKMGYGQTYAGTRIKRWKQQFAA